MVCRYMNTDELLTASEMANLKRRREISNLHDAGLSPREIALALSLSTQAIYKALKNLGIKPNRKV